MSNCNYFNGKGLSFIYLIVLWTCESEVFVPKTTNIGFVVNCETLHGQVMAASIKLWTTLPRPTETVCWIVLHCVEYTIKRGLADRSSGSEIGPVCLSAVIRPTKFTVDSIWWNNMKSALNFSCIGKSWKCLLQFAITFLIMRIRFMCLNIITYDMTRRILKNNISIGM